MVMLTPVISQTLMIHISCYVVASITHVVGTVILVVLASNKRLGGSQRVTNHLCVNLATVLDTLKNVHTTLRWTGSTVR